MACPKSCKYKGVHSCHERGPHCETHCDCDCHWCVTIKMSREREKLFLHMPKAVTTRIKQIWDSDIQHAAKQAFCHYLDVTGLDKTDGNAVVDRGLEIGMLAERMRHGTATEFIGAFERSILNHNMD